MTREEAMAAPMNEVREVFKRTKILSEVGSALNALKDSGEGTVPSVDYSEQVSMLREVLLLRALSMGVEISPLLTHLVHVNIPEAGVLPSKARDIAAAINFVAWEIEQRAIEAQKGGGE